MRYPPHVTHRTLTDTPDASRTEHEGRVVGEIVPIKPETPRILYVDDAIVLVDKASGLLVHRGWGDDEHVAMTLVRDRLGGWVYPVHRLDRGTSGVLVFGRSSEVASQLSKAFEMGAVTKTYLALVRGEFPEAAHIDYAIPRGEGKLRLERIDAVTDARRIATSNVDRCSLVEATPRTGRLHQIRRHVRHLNHPIIGDVNYGNGAINRHYRSEYGLHRLALHACQLAFKHPVSGIDVVVRAQVPEDLRGALRQLGLDGSWCDERPE